MQNTLKTIISTGLDIDIVLASYEIQRLYDHCDRKSSCLLLRDLESKPLGYGMFSTKSEFSVKKLVKIGNFNQNT